MATPQAPLCLVVDDSRVVRKVARRMLEGHGFIVAEAEDGWVALNACRLRMPDCVLLDLWLGSTCALDLLPAIDRQPAYVPVVFLSAQADVNRSVLAMKHGAIDFLTKPVEPGPLLDAVIRAVARARTWREAAATRTEAADRLASLTRRELEVFDQVVLGKPNKRIAVELGTSEKTVKVHRGRVMHKLAAHSVVDLVRLADRARGS